MYLVMMMMMMMKMMMMIWALRHVDNAVLTWGIYEVIGLPAESAMKNLQQHLADEEIP